MIEPLSALVSASPWTYALVLVVAALDAVIPLVPSESTAIAAGVLAGTGDLSLALVIAAAAAGAFAGDNVSYLEGRTVGTRLGRRLEGKRLGAARAWAERALERRGGYLIVVARFVPGGRTAVTLTAGLTRMPAPRFAAFAAVAALVWAAFASLLGYAGGRVFSEEPLAALAVAFAAAAALTVAVELARRRPLHRHVART